MCLYRLLKNDVAFDPEQLKVLIAAYVDVLRDLHLSGHDEAITETVAKKIIQISRFGERDPERIKERAKRELGIGRERELRVN